MCRAFSEVRLRELAGDRFDARLAAGSLRNTCFLSEGATTIIKEVVAVPGEGEQVTGVSDLTYNLGSVFYHAAHGGEVYAKYIEDAEREGDQELADFFREVQRQDAERAQRAKSLLARR
jgi:hypothetical protein